MGFVSCMDHMKRLDMASLSVLFLIRDFIQLKKVHNSYTLIIKHQRSSIMQNPFLNLSNVSLLYCVWNLLGNDKPVSSSALHTYNSK